MASSLSERPSLRLCGVATATGLLAGVAGMLLAMLLHALQHLAFGYSVDHVISHESFLQGVGQAPPWRRVAVMAVCGMVAGFGWWWVYTRRQRLVSVRAAVASDDPRMPGAPTVVHALLQIVTVALGSPLGREVAPREIGALIGSWLSRRARLDSAEAQLMVACGAGAGLAAVYNVPLGGAVFVLEVLLARFSWQAAVMAMGTSVLAAGVAWIGLGNESQYTLPALPLSYGIVVFALLAGPLLGLAARAFLALTDAAAARSPTDGRLPLLAIANFTVIGLLAIPFPQLLGNGKGPAQLGFAGELTVGLAACLLVLKVLLTSSSLRVGARGGLLTPSLAIGALLATVLGAGWTQLWPGGAPGAFALIGASAFLAAFMRMPFTAVVLMAEFTRLDHDLLIPILLAVAGATLTARMTLARGQGRVALEQG